MRLYCLRKLKISKICLFDIYLLKNQKKKNLSLMIAYFQIDTVKILIKKSVMTQIKSTSSPHQLHFNSTSAISFIPTLSQSSEL